MTVTNIFNQDPNAPPTPVVPAPVQMTPAPVRANVPVQPTPPPRPSGCGCPVALARAVVVGLGLIVFVIVAINLILGALGIAVFGREWFDKNVMLPLGSWVLTFVVGGSKTRLGYWVVASVFGPVFAIVLTWNIARGTKK